MPPADQPDRHALSPSRSPEEVETMRQLLASLQGGLDLRVRKIRRVRAAIKVRAYENSLKLSIATDRLLTDVKRADAADAPSSAERAERTERMAATP